MSDSVDGASPSRWSVILTMLLTVAAIALLAVGLAIAGAGNPKAGGYKGTTNNGKPVSFTVSGGKVKNPRFTIKQGGCQTTTKIQGSDKISKSGRFSVEGAGDTRFKGKFTSNTKATGTATVQTVSIPGIPSCGTMKASYTAKHK